MGITNRVNVKCQLCGMYFDRFHNQYNYRDICFRHKPIKMKKINGGH